MLKRYMLLEKKSLKKSSNTEPKANHLVQNGRSLGFRIYIDGIWVPLLLTISFYEFIQPTAICGSVFPMWLMWLIMGLSHIKFNSK